MHTKSQLLSCLLCVCVLSHFSLTFWDPMDYSPPGSSVRGILQARMLEWVAMPSSKGIFPTQGLNLSLLCLLHQQSGSLPLVRGKDFAPIKFAIWRKKAGAGILGSGSSPSPCHFQRYRGNGTMFPVGFHCLRQAGGFEAGNVMLPYSWESYMQREFLFPMSF